MNLNSIKKIRASNIWIEIMEYPHYVDQIVIHDGGFKSMYLFFSHQASVKWLKRWSDELVTLGVGERLDDTHIIETYNKIMKFS